MSRLLTLPSPDRWITGGATDMPSAKQRMRITVDLDDLGALSARAEIVRAERAAAEAAMLAADTGKAADLPTYEQACEDFDLADDELVLLERRIDELEEEQSWAATRAERREFWRAAL
jgi:hypothetical protein